MAAVSSASGSMYLQSPPPPEIPSRKKAKVEVEEEEEGPEGYGVFEGKYDYGDGIFSGISDGVEEEHWLYNLYVIYYDDGDKPREKVSAYMKQIAESEGFDLDDSPDAFIGSIRPLGLPPHQSDYQNIMECLRHAIDENNAAHPLKPKLEFVRLKKANFSSCAGRKYYITFVAKELDSQKNFTFQAKILYGIRGRLKVLIFRPLYKSPGVKWTRKGA